MVTKYHYKTVLDALNDLKKKGFNHDFNLDSESIKSHPNDFAIEHVYRYEGDSDPDEEAVVYGIASISGEKGYFVSGFSANSDNEISLIIERIHTVNNK